MTLRKILVATGAAGAGVALAKALQLRRVHQDSSPTWRPGDWPPVPSPAEDSKVGSGQGGEAK